jgi:AcrR family transcriptional regulator
MQQAGPRLDRDARREAILGVAQEVFLEEGFAAASMSTTAARLGGSKGTLYDWFKSKDDTVLAYVERRRLWQQDDIFAVRAEGETPLQALQPRRLD